MNAQNSITRVYFFAAINLLCLFYFGNAIAQNHAKIDSLNNELKVVKEDSSKVKLYLKLGELTSNQSLDTALITYKKALAICEKHGLDSDSLLFKTLLVKSLNKVASIYFLSHKGGEALGLYERALSISNTLGNKFLSATMLNNIGNVYYGKGNYTKTLYYYLESLKIQKEIKATPEMAIALNNVGTISNIGMVYDNIGDYASSLKYYKEALKANTQINNTMEIARSLNMIGVINSEMGQYDTALKYQLQVSKYANELDKNKRFAINHFLSLGFVLRKMKHADDAIKYFEKALAMSKSVGIKIPEIHALNGLSDCYYDKKDADKSLDFANQSLLLCKSLGLTSNKVEVLSNLSKIYQYKGDYKNALNYYQQYVGLNDSIFGKETKEKLNELQVQYETEKKEKEIANLNTEVLLKGVHIRNRNLIIVGIVLLSILLLALFSRYHIKRRFKIAKEKFAIEKQLVEIEQKALLLQMNPHFIYNSLSSIGGLIYENKPQVAIKYLTRFSKLMRLVLEYSLEPFIPLEKEIELLEYYLELEKLRFEDKFNYTIHTDYKADKQVSIPPMLIQPHVENSILHGFRNIAKEGKLDIHIIIKENAVRCEITDNGVGRDLTKALKGDALDRRNSTDISNERLELISKKNNKLFKIEIVDLKDNDNISLGTKVILDLPASFI